MSNEIHKQKLTIELDKNLYDRLKRILDKSDNSLDDYITDLVQDGLKNRHLYEMNRETCSHPGCPYQEHSSKVRIRR